MEIIISIKGKSPTLFKGLVGAGLAAGAAGSERNPEGWKKEAGWRFEM